MGRLIRFAISTAFFLAAAGLAGCEGAVDSHGATSQDTSIAEQRLRINLTDASLLLLTPADPSSATCNLKRVDGTSIQEVFEWTDQKAAVAAAAGLPQVSHVFVGPDGGVVLLFLDDVFLDGEACSFMRVDRGASEPECIDPHLKYLTELATPQKINALPGGHLPVQFDAGGNVYFAADGSVFLWDAGSGSMRALISEKAEIFDFLVTPEGLVWIMGRTIEGSVHFLSRINADGSFDDVEAFSAAFMTVAEDGALFAAGAPILAMVEGLFRLSPSGDPFSSMDLILPSDEFGMGDDYLSPHRVADFQMSADQSHYYLWDSDGGRRLLKAYPDVPAIVNLPAEIDQLTSFRILGGDLYLIGADAAGRHVFLRARLDDPETAEDLLEKDDIEINRFDVVDGFVYFDGFRFLDNRQILGQIDLNDGNRVTELMGLPSPLLGLERLAL